MPNPGAHSLGSTPWMPHPGANSRGSIPGSGESCLKACPFSWMPVCDSNGKTHANKCVFEGAACEARKKGILIYIAKEVACQGTSTKFTVYIKLILIIQLVITSD